MIIRVGSREWRWYLSNRLRLQGKPEPTGHKKRDAVIKEALSLVGIHEEPMGSNKGKEVERIQASTKAYGLPWCVSTIQYIWMKTLSSTWANDTANAYYLETYAKNFRMTIPRPVAGCAVVYHIGDGHAGTVIKVNSNGTFWAIEGNWGDAVVKILRDPKTIPCTFILRPELKRG
jgi:hypothetical protein